MIDFLQKMAGVSPLLALRMLAGMIAGSFARQKSSVFLWTPVFLGVGIGLYFLLPVEPPLILGIFAVIFCLSVLGIVWERDNSRIWAALLLLIAAGFLASQLRVAHVHTPILAKEIGPVSVAGTVAAIEDQGDEAGSRVILNDLRIEDLRANQTPVKVRLKVWKDADLQIGQRLDVLAKLHPPSEPLYPGGFDFQRYLYFQQIGAVGFAYKAEVLDSGGSRNVQSFIEAMRNAVTRQVEAHLSYPEAGVAMALITGRRTAINDGDQEAMRDAGLAHMLAISGLHIGLFAGVIFFIVRLGLAAVPNIALTHPIKKYAAVTAIMGAFIYMLLAGATIPSQRAWLMTSIVLIAVILDRSPLSLRLVVFAALVVLLVMPESLLSASFHMSFAAVVSLVLFYEWLGPYWSGWHRRAGFLRRLSLYFLGVTLTTLVAGFATAPFALFHFGQWAVYGVLANFLAMPVLAFLIMPAAVLSLALMPFQLSWLPLWVMGQGVGGVLDIAHWTASLPQATVHVAHMPFIAFLLLVVGCLFWMLWQGAGKWLGVLPIVTSLFVIFEYKQPYILISSDFDLVSVKPAEGPLMVSSLQKARFTRENWASAYGLQEENVKKWPAEGAVDGMQCGELGCRTILNGYNTAFVHDRRALAADCYWADIVISPEPVDDRRCAADVVVDRFDVWRGGAHGIWLGEDVLVRAVKDERGARPWAGERFGVR